MCSLKYVYMMWANKPPPFFQHANPNISSELKYFVFESFTAPNEAPEQRFGCYFKQFKFSEVRTCGFQG